MKMKEKKTEEVVEETPKVSDELMEYLEFARFCIHQHRVFSNCCEYELQNMDALLERMGLDVSKPVTIVTGFSQDTIAKEYDEFIQKWIIRYNELDLSKLDNYTKASLCWLTPNPYHITTVKDKFKKCVQHTTEE